MIHGCHVDNPTRSVYHAARHVVYQVGRPYDPLEVKRTRCSLHAQLPEHRQGHSAAVVKLHPYGWGEGSCIEQAFSLTMSLSQRESYPGTSSHRRLDVLIVAEQIRRIVLVLQSR
jgi:hypothetical protein